MYLYLIAILFFLTANYLVSGSVKKYTYEKFFIYIITYFILVNFINLIYLQNINFFTFQALFSVFMLFLYSGLYRSVSVKIMIYCFEYRKLQNFLNYTVLQVAKFPKLYCARGMDQGEQGS